METAGESEAMKARGVSVLLIGRSCSLQGMAPRHGPWPHYASGKSGPLCCAVWACNVVPTIVVLLAVGNSRYCTVLYCR